MLCTVSGTIMLRHINQLTMILQWFKSSRLKQESLQSIKRATFSTSINPCSRRSSKNRVDKRLQRLLEKKKYRYSFEAVSHTQLGDMVNQVSIPRKGAKVMGPEESVKLKTYNTILHEHVDGLVSSNLISHELQDLQVSIIGVRLTGDMSTCRIFWQASGNHEEDQKIQNVLDSHAGRIRHALINHRVLGKIPQLAFLQERTAAMKAQVESLLEKAEIPAEDSQDDGEEAIDISSGSMADGPLEEEEDRPPDEGPEPVLGLDQSKIQNQIKLMKLRTQKQNSEFSGTTEGSIEKFKSSVKKRKKARDKGLYDAGSLWRE